ncbi:hypothetical protein [Kosakonia phage Kc166B]|nr:hypothetical protein [Kosakonia phage Kc166B]
MDLVCLKALQDGGGLLLNPGGYSHSASSWVDPATPAKRKATNAPAAIQMAAIAKIAVMVITVSPVGWVGPRRGRLSLGVSAVNCSVAFITQIFKHQHGFFFGAAGADAVNQVPNNAAIIQIVADYSITANHGQTQTSGGTFRIASQHTTNFFQADTLFNCQAHSGASAGQFSVLGSVQCVHVSASFRCCGLYCPGKVTILKNA